MLELLAVKSIEPILGGNPKIAETILCDIHYTVLGKSLFYGDISKRYLLLAQYMACGEPKKQWYPIALIYKWPYIFYDLSNTDDQLNFKVVSIKSSISR